MKKKVISVLLSMMMIGSLAGCSSGSGDSGSGDAASSDLPYAGQEISILWVSNSTMDGINAVIEAAEEKLGLTVNLEQVPGGEDGDNVVKTRLASGDMADLLSYNCGALLSTLNPSEYFTDLTADYADKLDENFVNAAGVDGVLYGIPASASQAGAVLYNLDM